MAKDPMELQMALEKLLNSRNVYSQPPPSIKLSYPCVIFSKEDENVGYADNSRFTFHNQYSLTVISREANPKFCEEISKLPLCSFSRRYTSDNLYHNVYRLFW